MNVRCPSCEALYRVDPAKVTEQGVRARCAECPAVISISHASSDLSTGTPYDAPAVTVGTETLVPPPLVAAEQAVELIAEPAEQTGDLAAADDGETPVMLETEVTDESAAIEIPEPFGTHESVDEEIPPLPDGPIIEPEVSAPVTDELPPLPEVLRPIEAVADYVTPVDELPPVPDLPAAAEPADIEIPAPAPEPTERPALEVLPSVESPPVPQPRRYTRPFLKPPGGIEPQQGPVVPGPLRPTAPVFRPTPGMPIQPPPVAEPIPTVDTVPAPPAQVPVPQQPEPKPRRPVNPFLSKDPNQKARRLARALISDMIVYQPQKRQDALAAGTLKQAFDEEIKKSWEEYVGQIGDELARSTGFFKDALNEILAGGQEIF